MRIWLAEITAAIDASGTTTTLRFSSGAFCTGPAETPANAYYEPRITQPALLQRDCFDVGTTGGASRVGYGALVLANPDGGLDYLLDYGFDGRTFVLRVGEEGAAYPSGFPVVFQGTMEQPAFTNAEVSIRLRDRQAELDKPLQSARYAGNNVLPAGLEGVESDLKGQTKPRVFGVVKNISPPCVNTARLIYQISSNAVQSVDAVYDRGAALTAGANYVSQIDMETNAPAAGTFRAWPAGGYFRIGSTPAGMITADVTADTTANRTAAQIAKTIALAAGIAAGDITAADITALDSANSAAIALWLAPGEETTAREALDHVCASVGAWWGFDRLGKFRIVRLEAPSGTPVLELGTDDITRLERKPSDDAGRGVPAWRIKLSYEPNWTVQDSDLAGAVTDARRAWLKLAARTATAEDATVKNKHQLSPEMAFDSLLAVAADANTEAARLLTLYKTRRDRFEVRIYTTTAALNALDLGVVVRMTHARYGLSGGKLFRVIGFKTNLANNSADLTVWG